MTVRANRTIFWCYAVVLFIGTHWPKLRVEGPVPRSDLWMHFVAFGLWAFLASRCAWFGAPHVRRTIVLTWLIGVGYAAIDEGLQSIPALGRTTSWEDFGANVVGVTLGVVTAAIVSIARRPAT